MAAETYTVADMLDLAAALALHGVDCTNGMAVTAAVERAAASVPEEHRRQFVSRAKLKAANDAGEAGALKRGSIFANQRMDSLAHKLRQGVPPVDFLPSPTMGEKFFYKGNLFVVAGHKKSGKTWALLIQSADMLRAGLPVVYIDNENGWEVLVERLLLLGVDPDVIGDLFIYVPFPEDIPPTDQLRGEFEAIAEEFPRALVVIDSLRSMMSHYGLNPNADVEVEKFLKPIMGAVKGQLTEDDRITVGIIDHSNRATKDGDQFAAGGSQAKAAGVDAVYQYLKDRPYSRHVEGLVKINTVDDRRGYLDHMRYFRIGGQGEALRLFFSPADADEVGAMAEVRASVLDFLTDNEGQQFTPNAVVNAKSVTGKAENIRKALDLLVDTVPQVHKDPNPRRKDSMVYGYDPTREDAAGGLSL
jgi:hypothetical protein